jgi:hypothetical protein
LSHRGVNTWFNAAHSCSHILNLWVCFWFSCILEVHSTVLTSIWSWCGWTLVSFVQSGIHHLHFAVLFMSEALSA